MSALLHIPRQIHSLCVLFCVCVCGLFAIPRSVFGTTKKVLKFITRARATYHHVIIITQAETFNFTHSKLQCN